MHLIAGDSRARLTRRRQLDVGLSPFRLQWKERAGVQRAGSDLSCSCLSHYATARELSCLDIALFSSSLLIAFNYFVDPLSGTVN